MEVEIILADPKLNDIKYIESTLIDIALGNENDFEVKIDRSNYISDYSYGNIIYVPGTEFGGIIKDLYTNTAESEITIAGQAWRGNLEDQIIEPPTGQDYKIVSGELNTVIGQLISEAGLSPVFAASTIDTGKNVTNFQFNRYCTLLDGIKDMCESIDYRINLEYIQQEQGNPGFVQISAVPITDYSNDIELSEDYNINFKFNSSTYGVNHLICLGQGELSERTRIDLFIQADGSVGTSQYYTGIQEVTQVYENSNAENAEVLQEEGTKKIKELAAQQTFEMDVASLDMANIQIGDIVGGRDYITGLYAKQPIAVKIWRYENGTVSIDYGIEGATDEETSIS